MQVVQVSERTVLNQKAYMLFYFRDRKTFPSKKPIDVVQKQNLVASAIARKTCSTVGQDLKETIQYGPVDKGSNDVVASAAVTQNDMSNVGLSKEFPSKETSAPKSRSSSSERMALKNGPISEPSLSVSSSKQWVKGPPIVEKSMSPSAPSVKVNGITNLGNAVAASTDARFNEISKEDQGISDVIQANGIGYQSFAADKRESEKTSLRVIGYSIPSEVYICGGFNTLFLTHETFFMQVSNADETLEKIEPVKLPSRSSGENFEVAILFIECLRSKLLVWSNIDIFPHCRLVVYPKGFLLVTH